MSTAALVLVTNPGIDAIATYRLDGDDLHPLAVTTGLDGVGAFAIDEARNLVYAGVKGDQPGVVTLSLDRDTGALTPVARADVDASMTYLALAPGGDRLLGASYGGHFGLVWVVDADGHLGRPAARVEFPHLHCVVATDTHAYFVSLGADLIAQYDLAADGALTPLDPATVATPAGSGPRHLVLSTDGRHAYLVTEFSGEAIHLTRDERTGVLTVAEALPAYDTSRGLGHSVLGADPLEHHYIWGADLHLTPDGRRLLCSERTESTITTIDVAEDGRPLRQLAVTVTERQPRGFVLTPDGTRVLATGEKSDRLALSRLEADGTLTGLSSVTTGPKANWVRTVPLA